MWSPSLSFDADLTPTGHLSLFVCCFDGAMPRGDELIWLINRSQPKTVEVGKIVTGTLRTLALYEGVSSEVLQAATRRGQRLATTFITSSCMLNTGGQLVTIKGVDNIILYTHLKSLTYSPGGKSILTTGSSSLLGMVGPFDPGCEQPLQVKLSHIPHSGWCGI